MAKRTPPTNTSITVINPPATITAAGHSGHTISVSADYAYWCENDNAYVNEDVITSRKNHK